MPQKRKFLIAFVGPVGSGKTYIARILARKLGAVHINTDEIRLKLKLRGKPISRAAIIANRLHGEALEKGKSVIVDFDAVNPKRQQELGNLAEKFGARFFLIKIRVPEKVILKRLRSRDYAKHDIFKKVYGKSAVGVYFLRKKWHQRKFHTRPDFVIDNARTLAPQITGIIKKSQGL